MLLKSIHTFVPVVASARPPLPRPTALTASLFGSIESTSLARFGHGFRRVLELCALALQSPGLIAPEIVHDQAIARLDQVGRHAAAHAAGADESQSLHASHSLNHCPTKPIGRAPGARHP